MNAPEAKKIAPSEPEKATAAIAANGQIVAQCWLQVMQRLTISSLVKLYVADASQRTEVTATRTALRSRARTLLETELVVAGERRRLADLEVAELEAIHCNQMLTTATVGAHTINARLSLLRSAFNWAAVIGLWSGANPTSAIKWRKAERTERALSDRMFRFLIHGLRVTENLQRTDLEWTDFPTIAAATGLRPGDVRTIQTADVDLELHYFRCRQKGDRLLEIPYPRSIGGVMRRRVEAARGRQYVFSAYLRSRTGRSTTRPVHKTKPGEVWREEILPVLTDLAGAREQANLTVDQLAARLGVPRKQVEEFEAISAGFDGFDAKGKRVTLAYFRATNVTTKLRRGASTKHAGASVGHDRERTTENHYVGSLFEQLQDTAALMDEYFEIPGARPESSEADEPPEKVVGRNIRRIRESKHLSQAELGRRLGATGKPVGERTIREWETQGLADLRVATRVAQALGVRRVDVLEGVA